MIIIAAVIGVLAGYYFGVKIGAIAAVVAAVLLAASMVLPGSSLMIYAVLGVAVAGILFIGPKMQKSPARKVVSYVGKAKSLLDKVIRKASGQ